MPLQKTNFAQFAALVREPLQIDAHYHKGSSNLPQLFFIGLKSGLMAGQPIIFI